MGNGRRTSFWFDTWTPFGQLISFLGETGPSLLRVPIRASVANASDGRRWKLASPRSDDALTLIAHLTTVKPPTDEDDEDYYDWRTSVGVAGSTYTARRTWEVLRSRAEPKEWAKQIWFMTGCQQG